MEILPVSTSNSTTVGTAVGYRKALLASPDVSALDKSHYQLENLSRRFIYESEIASLGIVYGEIVNLDEIKEIASFQGMYEHAGQQEILQDLKISKHKINAIVMSGGRPENQPTTTMVAMVKDLERERVEGGKMCISLERESNTHTNEASPLLGSKEENTISSRPLLLIILDGIKLRETNDDEITRETMTRGQANDVELLLASKDEKKRRHSLTPWLVSTMHEAVLFDTVVGINNVL
ncbi:hypothetical protein Tco_0734508 [Tanacetum coccineum]